MENVLFKIAKIFREVKKSHNLINITLFEENEKEIENSVLNYIINCMSITNIAVIWIKKIM